MSKAKKSGEKGAGKTRVVAWIVGLAVLAPDRSIPVGLVSKVLPPRRASLRRASRWAAKSGVLASCTGSGAWILGRDVHMAKHPQRGDAGQFGRA